MASGVDMLTAAEARDRADVVSDLRAQVHLDLTADQTFRMSAQLRFSATAGARTFLDVDGTILRAELNGRELVVRDGTFRLELPELAVTNIVSVEMLGRYRDDYGLIRSIDPADDAVYLYTKGEPHFAHRIFPCFDQPDLPVRLALTVSAPAGATVLAATTGVPSGSRDGDSRLWTFPETPPLPPYVASVAVGPFLSRHDRIGGLPVGVHCRASLRSQVALDGLLQPTRAWLGFFESLFGHPYPYAKLDWVFVPDFEGALENAACILAGEHLLPGATVLPHEMVLAEGTLAHELAHMWFGDFVTLRWWDDLWLKEAMATFAGVAAVAEQRPEAWLLLAAHLVSEARELDAGPTSHAVASPVADTIELRSRYDAITYMKGAALIQQLEQWIGTAAFRAALGDFVDQHAFGAAQLSDLVASFAKASGRDVSAWARSWLEAAGHGQYRLLREPGELIVVPVRPTRPACFDVAVYRHDGRTLTLRTRLAIDVTDGPVRVSVPADYADDLLLPDPDRVCFATFLLARPEAERIIAWLGDLDEPLARTAGWDHLWSLVLEAQLPAERFLDAVHAHAANEANALLLSAVLERAGRAVDLFVAAERAGTARVWLAALCADQVQRAAAGSLQRLVWAARLAGHAGPAEADLVRGLVEVAPGTLRRDLVRRLAALGQLSVADIDALLVNESRRARLGVHAARPDPGAKATAWRLATSDLSLTPEDRRTLAEGFWQPDQVELLAPYATAYVAALAEQPDGPLAGLGLAKQWFPRFAVTEGTITRVEELAGSPGTRADLSDVLASGAFALRRALRCREIAVDLQKVAP